MLNRSVELRDSTRILEALPGKLDIKRHSPSSLYIFFDFSLTVKAAPHECLIRTGQP